MNKKTNDLTKIKSFNILKNLLVRRFLCVYVENERKKHKSIIILIFFHVTKYGNFLSEIVPMFTARCIIRQY